MLQGKAPSSHFQNRVSSHEHQRPTWLPAYIPELQGLRGLAVLAVVVYHCHPRLAGTVLYYLSLWGWAGVNLFFVLSGFLITSILLEARDKENYFRNFYARRALRIWPVYLLVLAVCYANAPWFIGPSVWDAVKTAPWWAYLFFLQNLFHLRCRPRLGKRGRWPLRSNTTLCGRRWCACCARRLCWQLSSPARSSPARWCACILSHGSRPRIRLSISMASRSAACWRWGFTRSRSAAARGSHSASRACAGHRGGGHHRRRHGIS